MSKHELSELSTRRARHLRARPGRPLGRARVLGRSGLAGRAGRACGRLPLHRAPALQGLVALHGAGDRRGLRRARRGAERCDVERDDRRLCARPGRTAGDRARRHGGHGVPAVVRRARLGARGRARGDRDGRGHAARPRPRHRGRGRLRRPSARPAGDRTGRGDLERLTARVVRVPPARISRRSAGRLSGRERPPRASSSRCSRSGGTVLRDSVGLAARKPVRRATPPQLRFQRKDTEQYHVCLSAPGHRADGRTPLRRLPP